MTNPPPLESTPVPTPAPSRKPSPSLWRRALLGVGSLKVATTLLLLLMILTFAGTWEQQHTSLYDVQAKFFESIIFIWWVGGVVPVPLLGGYLLLSVLFVNLLVGGVIRLRKSKRTIGILIAHLGILSLLAGSFVEHQFSTKGQMTLNEGAHGNEYQSVHEWEVAVSVPKGEGETEYVIPWDTFRDLGTGESVRWKHAGLPFDLVISDVVRNGQVVPAKPGDPTAIEGFVLNRVRPVTLGSRVNVPGLLVTAHPTSGARASRSILWGIQAFPWDYTLDGVRYIVDLRRRTFQMPFSVRLDTFEHELHPGMGMAKRYSSFVTKIDGATQERVHITMNEPLRWRGYTLYQSDYGPKPEDKAPEGTPKYSTFSVVANPSDQWPKWMTWIIAIGLLIHFSIKLAQYLSREERRRRVGTTALVLGLGLALFGCGAEEPTQPAWSDDIVDTMERVPVQAEGRVKPLSTWAAFSLLSANHRRSCYDADENKVAPTSWWLDAVFRPDWAKKHQCFVVPTNEILDAIGNSEAVKKKRDRYSYEELVIPPARGALSALADEHLQIEPKKRTRVQAGVVALERSLRSFEGLLELAAFAREDFTLGHPEIEALFEGRKTARFSELLEKSDALNKLMRAADAAGAGGDDTSSKAREAVSNLFVRAFNFVDRPISLGLMPSTAKEGERLATWMTMRDVGGFAFVRSQIAPEHLAAVRALEGMARATDDSAEFAKHASAYETVLRKIASARGEHETIDMEVHLYSFNPFGKSLMLYILAFMLVCVMWLRPNWRWLAWTVFGLVTATVLLHSYGIVLRCIIRGRPPVSTLYETILFITASGVILLLAMELFNGRRIALALAPIIGAIGLFVAGRYEVLKGEDTMPQLVAVLDTNFWLMTHVTCISIGYCAGLLAAAIAHAYVFARVFRGNKPGRDWYTSVFKMVYGILCFALLFSLVGTILGGIWANDSWGRFWGWDPKENGALLIVLSQLAMLHARMAGWLKPFGFCMAAIFGGMIVGFSWWGVNLLGIGLHSYGFTSGIFNGLLVFYCLEAAVLLLGLYAFLRDRGGVSRS